MRDVRNIPHRVQRSMRALSKAYAEHCAELKKWALEEGEPVEMLDVTVCGEAYTNVTTDFLRNLWPCVAPSNEGISGFKRAAAVVAAKAGDSAWQAFETFVAAMIVQRKGTH